VASACNDLPDYDTRCAQATTRWDPEWKEGQTRLPPPPSADDLAPIDAPRAADGYAFFIDRRSVSRGSDGVMRYTVVVESRTGARNVFHEGLRCLTDEVRTYAYATRRGPFRRAGNATWRRIATDGPRGYQDYLANVIMCDRQGYAWDADKALRALSAQYTAGGVLIERSCKDQDRCGPYNRSD
jgi:hypothetical protein